MFIVLSGASDIPLYQQIVDQIRTKILSRELQPGDPLPSIRQLAADLLTSVITTKRAYQELEQAELIQTRPGLGTFVSVLRQSSVEEIKTKEIRGQLIEVLQKSYRLGMSTEALRRIMEQILQAEEEKHGK